jgi:hypothetical protein
VLGAHAGAGQHRALTCEAAAAHKGFGGGHPSRRYPCPYVPTEAPGPTLGEERTRRWGHILALRRNRPGCQVGP